jgi:uncharacterized damage-inducible protein DinB
MKCLRQRDCVVSPRRCLIREGSESVADPGIRRGRSDGHTSLPVIINLVTGLENRNKDVNALLYWDAGHGFSAQKLRQLKGRIIFCLEKLSEDQVWLRGSGNENAVGNLCLHLAGNVRQCIGHGVAGQEDKRVRDLEFSTRGGRSIEELGTLLTEAVEEAAGIIERLKPESLMLETRVQNYDLTVLSAIYHVVEHFAQHTGQIIFATKALTGEDLGFHAHLSGRSTQPPPAGQQP